MGHSMALTIAKNFGDTWYYANDGGDYRYFSHFFVGDAFESKAGKMTFEEWILNGRIVQIVAASAKLPSKKG